MPNQNPEQIARDNIDAQLAMCGWVVQAKSKIDLEQMTESRYANIRLT